MNAPVFFVVGAAKAGTTSVYHYLKQHPEVFMHPYKDIACYFCERYGMAITLDEFKTMLQPGDVNTRVTGDVCSDYLSDPGAANEISRVFPGAKIIIILRNPADRAFSLYQWMIREGYEYLSTFREALAAESGRMSRKLKGMDLVSPSKNAYLYFHSGLYSEQVKRFLDRFPREQTLILKYDDLRNDGLAFMRSIYSFLGVDTAFTPEFMIYNRASRPLSVTFQYFCRRRLSRLLPNALLPFIMRINMSKSGNSKLDPGLHRELLDKYAQDIRVTAAITGLDLHSWLPA